MEHLRLPLEASIFRVTSSDPKNKSSGTAFAIAREGATTYLATCAHVVRDVGKEQVMVNATPARVVIWGSSESPDDVAVLEARLPVGAMPIGLEFTAEPGVPCTVHGSPAEPLVKGVYQLISISGKLGSPTPLSPRLGERRIAAWYIEAAQDLVPGLSGSPVIDEETGEAIGMVTLAISNQSRGIAISDEETGKAIGLASLAISNQRKGIVISSDALRQLWREGRQQLERPGVTYKGIEFMYVPGGKFTMGTAERRSAELTSIENRIEFSHECPASRPYTPGFYIARFPVTNAQYARFIDATGWAVPYRDDVLSKSFNWDPLTRRYPEGMDNHPVVLVSWRDAYRYCSWLGGRLPTEAEWEKAARGTDAREWPWGNDWNTQCCNTIESGRKWLAPIGSYSPAGDSPYGVADMSGNVWEWCSSVADPYPYSAEDGRESVAAIGARVIRGGAWGHNRYQARCAYRNAAYPDDRGFTIGFRVAISRDAAHLWQVNE